MFLLRKAGGPEPTLTPEQAFGIVLLLYVLWTWLMPGLKP
jgi:hypothetical protein